MVVPAVIPESKEHLEETLRLFNTFAPEAQVDITDGIFTSARSWPYTEMESYVESALVALPALSIELDLMIQNPEQSLDAWMGLKPSRVVVHVESTHNLEAVLAHKRTHGYMLGLAFNNDTSLALLHELDRAAYDYVELMGIADIGAQGQAFDERVLARIQEVKARYPDLEVSVDGSVNQATLLLLKAAGADRFVVGSAILNAPDREAMYKTLTQLAA